MMDRYIGILFLSFCGVGLAARIYTEWENDDFWSGFSFAITFAIGLRVSGEHLWRGKEGQS